MKQLLFLLALALPMVTLAQQKNLEIAAKEQITQKVKLPITIGIPYASWVDELQMDTLTMQLTISPSGRVKNVCVLGQTHVNITNNFAAAAKKVRLSQAYIDDETVLTIGVRLNFVRINNDGDQTAIMSFPSVSNNKYSYKNINGVRTASYRGGNNTSPRSGNTIPYGTNLSSSQSEHLAASANMDPTVRTAKMKRTDSFAEFMVFLK